MCEPASLTDGGDRADRTGEACARTANCAPWEHYAFSKTVFEDIQTQLGVKFDFDACCSDDGGNALCGAYASPSRSFMRTDVAGRTCWINPPYCSDPTEFLKHYLACKQRAPTTTAACFVLPQTAWFRAPWRQLLCGMTLLRQYPARAKVLSLPDGTPTCVPWELEVWWDPPRQLQDWALEEDRPACCNVTVGQPLPAP